MRAIHVIQVMVSQAHKLYRLFVVVSSLRIQVCSRKGMVTQAIHHPGIGITGRTFGTFKEIKRHGIHCEPVFLGSNIWEFPKTGVPQNGWFIKWKTLLKWMIWGYHYFREHPYIHCTPSILNSQVVLWRSKRTLLYKYQTLLFGGSIWILGYICCMCIHATFFSHVWFAV